MSGSNFQIFINGICGLLIFSFVSSCAGSNENDSNTILSSTDSLVEYEINQDRASAVEFNNEMTFMQEGTLDMIDALFQSDTHKVELNHENCLFELEMNISTLEKYQKEEDKTDFSAAMIDLMNFYHDELTGDFRTVMPLLKQSTFSSKDEEVLNEYDLRFVKLEEAAFEKVFISQEAYAEANNISLDFNE